MRMQCCADTSIERVGASVSAAAVRNCVWLSILRFTSTWMAPRDSAGAVVPQEVDAVLPAGVRIADAIDDLHRYGYSVSVAQLRTDIPFEVSAPHRSKP